ncbi:EboA domain-containing protein [Actinoplanes missouriensis]|uniref:EboA domain-containing protein n=1 Tax=Actinoplanes missouriensis TaxID=1866 RepID=UPI0033C6AEBE
MTGLVELRAALGGNDWLDDALAKVTLDPAAAGALFPAAGRRCGRAPVAPQWTADEAARALLLSAAPGEAETLYRYGDADEKRAVLKALPLIAATGETVSVLQDALRTNDTRLVAAALGPAARQLDDATWRQGVLKCVFMGIPLTAVHGLRDRADAALAEMLGAFAEERKAAGRDVPADAQELLEQLKGA